ncbi:ABC-type Mn2+/Zn2+ transport system, permease component [Thiovulum sp. ES]|nr:ABC-type Mn2+/Zn2+ transport system, permease component [Thiovulum sp. ES]
MVEIFQYEFMQRAFIVGGIIGFVAPFLGIFIVLNRYSMLADTLAHISLLGVASGIAIGVSPTATTLFAVLSLSIFIEYLRTRYQFYSDSLLSLFLSVSLSLSIVIVSLSDNFNVSLLSYLFGSILTLKESDIWIVGITGFGIISFMLFRVHHLLSLTFDSEIAKVSGVKVAILNFSFLSLVAILIAFSINIIGSLLIGAMIVIPVVSALQYRQGFFATLLIAIIFSIFSVFLGLIISFFFSIPSGATIVLNSAIIFLISLLINRKR